MTALGDAFPGRIIMHHIRFIGTGLTPGDRLTITDGNGKVFTEHFIRDVTEDVSILGGGSRFWSNGLTISAFPSGNAEVQFHLL
jgi:hypothetical protein